MHVLIISKTTNLELHGRAVKQRVASGHMSKEYFDLLKRAHEDHYRTLGVLYNLLTQYGIAHQEIGRGHYWPDLSRFSAIITVGGDGTVLEASHHMDQETLPLLGIRSSSTSVGHLCFGNIHNLAQVIADLVQSSLPWVEVHRLYAEITVADTGGCLKTDPVLNDFLYANLSPAAMTRYRITLGETSEEHKSSGLWLATPAGSTAAIQAAGGAIQSLGEDSFQYLVRELYTPLHHPRFHLQKGFFHPNQDLFTIENLSEQAILALDGQHGLIALRFGDLVCFKKAPCVRLVAKPAL